MLQEDQERFPESDENTALTAKIESPPADKKKDKKKEKKSKKESPRKAAPSGVRSSRMVVARVLLLDGRDLEIEIEVRKIMKQNINKQHTTTQTTPLTHTPTP